MCERVVGRLFRLQIIGKRCSSLIGDKTVTLSSEFVRGATAVHIQFTLLWPILLPRFRPPAVCLSFSLPDGQRIADGFNFVAKRSWRRTCFSINLTQSATSDCQYLCIQSARQRDGRRLKQFHLNSLDTERVARELKVLSLEIYASESQEHIRCDWLHEAVSQVSFRVEVQIRDPSHRSFLTQVGAELRAELMHVDALPGHTGDWLNRFQFNGGVCRWFQRLGSAHGLFGEVFGPYRLSIRVGETVIAHKQFQLLPRSACVAAARNAVRQNATLKELSICAINHRGVSVPMAVLAEDFREVRISFTLKLPQPDRLISEVEMPLSCFVRHGEKKVLRHVRRAILKCGQGAWEFVLPVSPAMFEPGPGRYHLDVLLEDRLLESVGFLHQTRSQLKQAQAEAILQSLRLSEPHLLVLREGTCVETDHVFVTDHAIVPGFTIAGQGFDEDVPAIKWRLTIRFINLKSAEVIEEHRFLTAQAGPNIYQDLELPLQGPEQTIKPGEYALQLCRHDVVLTEFRFRLLDRSEIAPHTKQVVQRSLHVEDAQLLIQADGITYEGAKIPGSSDFILPQLVIYSAGYNSFLRKLAATLHLVLVGEDGVRREILDMPVTLSSEPTSLHRIAIKVRGGLLGSTPALYQLVVMIGQKMLTAFPFQIVSEPEVLSCLNVRCLNILTRSKSNGQSRNPSTLFLKEQDTVAVEVEIEAAILAPNMAAPGALILRIDADVVAHVDFELRLVQPRQMIRSRMMSWASLISEKVMAEREFVATVVIAGQEKATRSVTIICGKRISNFEGQLTIDPRDLSVDEEDYERILRQL